MKKILFLASVFLNFNCMALISSHQLDSTNTSDSFGNHHQYCEKEFLVFRIDADTFCNESLFKGRKGACSLEEAYKVILMANNDKNLYSISSVGREGRFQELLVTFYSCKK